MRAVPPPQGNALEGSMTGRFAADIARAVQGMVHGFRGEALNLRAGNLTFISIFSLVPLLTVALASMQLLQQDTFKLTLTRFIRDILAPGIQVESEAFLERFINSAASKAAGGLGFFFLLASAGMLLRHLDASLNEIWDVRKARPVLVSAALYLTILTLGPVVIALSLAGSSGLRELLVTAQLPYAREAIQVGAATVATVAFTVLYKVAPHAPVRFRSALAGGLVGGLGWEVAKKVYATFAALGFRYNPIYGSLSAVPLFLMWIYVSWWLVLFGARLSYAVEQATFRGAFRDVLSHPRAHELIAARIAQLTTESFYAGTPPPTPRELARQLFVPEQRVLELIHLLEKAQLVSLDGRGGLRPARAPEALTLADVSAAVGGIAKPLRLGAAEGVELQALERLYFSADQQSVNQLSNVSWASLVQPFPTASAAPPPWASQIP